MVDSPGSVGAEAGAGVGVGTATRTRLAELMFELMRADEEPTRPMEDAKLGWCDVAVDDDEDADEDDETSCALFE